MLFFLNVCINKRKKEKTKNNFLQKELDKGRRENNLFLILGYGLIIRYGTEIDVILDHLIYGGY